jgi:hypothetical protein
MKVAPSDLFKTAHGVRQSHCDRDLFLLLGSHEPMIQGVEKVLNIGKCDYE